MDQASEPPSPTTNCPTLFNVTSRTRLTPSPALTTPSFPSAMLTTPPTCPPLCHAWPRQRRSFQLAASFSVASPTTKATSLSGPGWNGVLHRCRLALWADCQPVNPLLQPCLSCPKDDPTRHRRHPLGLLWRHLPPRRSQGTWLVRRIPSSCLLRIFPISAQNGMVPGGKLFSVVRREKCC